MIRPKAGRETRARATLEVAIRDPLEAVRALAHLPYPFLLHTPLQHRRARWSFFGADPFAVFRGDDYGQAIALWESISVRAASATGARDEPPFRGGVVGYWAYDFGRRLERLPALAADDLRLPDVLLGFYDVVGAFDHATGRARLFSSGLPLDDPHRAHRACERLERFARLLRPPGPTALPLPPRGAQTTCARSTFSPESYRRAVEQVKEHIRAGDIFQANLSQRWSLALPAADPCERALALQQSIARVSPAPFSAFFAAPDHAVASASPEGFLELRSRRVETRPIKGTRPRAAERSEDARLEAELLASEKDRAENVMIVDVLRNDLGRVCETGSVRATALCELETFAQVHHLTSTVEGRLREGLGPFDLLHACFPGGSITGAPKIRAMEILEGLEPVRRHIYTGSLGYVDWSGDAEWNIAIRTALVTPRAIHFAAGGAITADSDPEAEYRETLHKAEGLRAALEQVAGPVRLEPAPVAVP